MKRCGGFFNLFWKQGRRDDELTPMYAHCAVEFVRLICGIESMPVLWTVI